MNLLQKPRYLIFLDIDGTLLNKHYKSNYPKLADFIKTLQNKGVVFSLNSNRALEDLLPIAKFFNINGPIIGENGIYIYFPQNRKVVFLLSKNEIEELKYLKNEVEEEILSTIRFYYPDKNINFHNIDTVKGLNIKTISKQEIYVLNNKYRKYSTSAHIKRVIRNKLVKLNNKTLKLFTLTISKKFEKESIMITFSPLFGNILMYSSKISKKEAAEYLCNNYFQKFNVISIGDELNDYKIVKDIGNFYTTSNSSQEVKNVAAYVSKNKYTFGVFETLQKKIVI